MLLLILIGLEMQRRLIWFFLMLNRIALSNIIMVIGLKLYVDNNNNKIKNCILDLSSKKEKKISIFKVRQNLTFVILNKCVSSVVR